MASGIFKRKQTSLSTNIKDLSVSDAALSQSTFNVEKVTDIQNKFRGGEVLLSPGRIFIRDGVLWKVCRKGPKKRHFFLFNDILVYGTIVSRGHYGNQHIMELTNMSVSSDCHYMPQVELDNNGDTEKGDSASSPSELKPDNAFQINHSDKSFHVYSHSRADKVNWINNLNKQISKISKGSDGGDHVYQRAVWVPDSASKQCMICKQKFSAFVRKHHCRMCGRVVCSACSPEKADIAKLSGANVTTGKLERICKMCKKPVVVVTGASPMKGKSDDKDGDRLDLSKNSEKSSSNDGNESSETEDSDDSENEDMPVPPPRRKKLQQPTHPTEQKKNVPPPRPSYTPPIKGSVRKSLHEETKHDKDKQHDDILEEKSIENEKDTHSSSVMESTPNDTPITTITTPTTIADSEASKASVIESTPNDTKSVDTSAPNLSVLESTPSDPSITNTAAMPTSEVPKPVPKPRRTNNVKNNATTVTDTINDDDSSIDNSTTTAQKENTVVDRTTDTNEDNKLTDVTVKPTSDEENNTDSIQTSIKTELMDEDGNKKENKPTVNKRRQKIVTQVDDENTIDGGTADVDSNNTTAAQLRDKEPVPDKPIRSPSTHARQRRSKFTSSASTAEH